MMRSAIAFAIILPALLTIAALRDQPRHPLLVDARLVDSPADRLFTPCPLTPRNIPRKLEKIA